MTDEMGIFKTRVGVESPLARGQVSYIDDVMVDTGSELSWFPASLLESLGIRRERSFRFRMANGSIIARDIGYAIVHAGGGATIDDVVFADSGDLPLLGARSIEGLNFKVDLANKRFLNAGPIVVAEVVPA